MNGIEPEKKPAVISYKSYDELTFSDDFMFCNILTARPDLCKSLLELILDIRIHELRPPESQQTVNPAYDSHGVRFDVLAEDAEGSIYDIEMQVRREKNLGKRMRYYHSMLDLMQLDRGKPYNQLHKTAVIFICMNDPFGAGLPVYHFDLMCRENSSVSLKDETERIIINARGNQERLSDEMKAFLDYLIQGRPRSALTEQLDEAVLEARQHTKWRQEYMSLLEKLREEREDGWEEGRKDGWEEGRKDGKKEGLEEGRILEAIHIFRDYMGMDDSELLKKLTTEYSLTGEEAAERIAQTRKAQ